MKTNQNQARLIGALALTHLIASGSALAADCSDLPEWGPAVEYVKDSRVQYQNVGYEANWWTRNESPESHSGPFQQWTSLGDCSVSNLPQVSLTSPLDGALLSKNDNVVNWFI